MEDTIQAKVIWKGGLSFIGCADRGHEINLAAYTDEGGGSSPMEMVLIALAGGTAIDVLSTLQKKRQHVDDFEVHVKADQSDDYPRVFTAASVQYIVGGDGVRLDAVEHAVELSRTKYCSVHAMLKQALPIEFSCRLKSSG